MTADFEFNILCFSESQSLEGISPKSSINLEGYQEPIIMPTKAVIGGVLMYIKDSINFVPRNDLDNEKDKKLESCFIEILNANQQISSLV